MGDVRVLVVGVGNMGASHAKAYHKLAGFEIAGLMSRSDQAARKDLPDELAAYPRFRTSTRRCATTRPDAVSINTWPNTHADYAIRAMDAGCHVFMEKPIATTYEDAEASRRQGQGEEPKTRPRLHPAPPSVVGEVRRGRPHAGQAAGHAHEPEPAVLGSGLELAQEPHGVADALGRLRGALRRHHVPDDPGEAGAGARHRGEAQRRDAARRTTAPCRSRSTTARSAGTRPAGGR